MKIMNVKAANFVKVLPLTLPFLIIASLILLTKSNFFSENSQLLSNAITVDLLLIVPLIYFLIIRKRDIPKITVLTMFIIGIVLLTYFLPKENQLFLNNVKTYVLPILELGIFSVVIYKVVQLSRAYKKQNKKQDFHRTLLEAATQVLPLKISRVLAVEVSMMYYGFIKWKSAKLSENEFSYHKKNALISILAGFTIIIIAETVGLHAWLVKWNPVVGWIVSFLSAYTAFQFFALLKSIPMRPIVIDHKGHMLHLRYGYFTELTINFDSITKVESHTKDLPEDKSITIFSPLGGIGEHNLVIYFKKELVFSGIYGIKRKAKALAIFVDDKERFLHLINESK
jgi:hypothetical protein